MSPDRPDTANVEPSTRVTASITWVAGSPAGLPTAGCTATARTLHARTPNARALNAQLPHACIVEALHS